jgi:hypothetical protein
VKENAVEAAAFAAKEINGQRDGSRRKALVAMVQPADLGHNDTSAVPRRLDRTRVRTILVEERCVRLRW